MKTTQTGFTIEQGKQVQADDLAFWEKILKPEVYKKLLKQVAKKQKETPLKTGYDVVRGMDITGIIYNKLK